MPRRMEWALNFVKAASNTASVELDVDTSDCCRSSPAKKSCKNAICTSQSRAGPNRLSIFLSALRQRWALSSSKQSPKNASPARSRRQATRTWCTSSISPPVLAPSRCPASASACVRTNRRTNAHNTLSGKRCIAGFSFLHTNLVFRYSIRDSGIRRNHVYY